MKEQDKGHDTIHKSTANDGVDHEDVGNNRDVAPKVFNIQNVDVELDICCIREDKKAKKSNSVQCEPEDHVELSEADLAFLIGFLCARNCIP